MTCVIENTNIDCIIASVKGLPAGIVVSIADFPEETSYLNIDDVDMWLETLQQSETLALQRLGRWKLGQAKGFAELLRRVCMSMIVDLSVSR
jgi:hypothetical protein